MAFNKGGKPYMGPEDRAKHPFCNAKKKNGERCKAFAGLGTDHKGIGPCKFHGGATRNHRQRAVVLRAQQEAATLGQPIPVSPDQALQGALAASAGHTTWLATEVANLDGLGSLEARTLVSLYGEERDRLTRVAKACIDAGMTKREVELQKQATKSICRAIESALKAVEGLTSEQRRAFGQCLRLELQQLQAAADEPDVLRAE
jgi:hypothetical protein